MHRKFMTVLKLDDAEIASRRAFFRLTDEDLTRLASLRPFAEKVTDGIVEEFYALLLGQPETKRFFDNEATIRHVKAKQREYFLGLFNGRCDPAYVEDRLRVGAAHERIGLEPKWYLGAYRQYLESITSALAREFGKTEEARARAETAFESIQRIVYFDMSLALDTYIAANLELERQAAEQQALARTEKLRALGQMAAGISHDLKNILNPISLHLQVVTRAIDRGKLDDAQESLLEIKQTLTRGVETLERLRSFSRQSEEAKTELVSLDALAREAAAIGKSRGAPEVIEELTEPPSVNAMGSEVVAAIVNLVVNAIEAGARTITLRSGKEDESQPHSGSWVEIADDGPGMPPDIAKRVFEPFFTTKGAEGTGLGLAMVYATMERHGGSVTIDTEEGKGTCFRLHFR